MMSRSCDRETVVVVGGGWGGCAAALSAARSLAGRGRTVLVERTDMLLGLGLCGGIFRNNGRFVAAEEGLALGGGGELFGVMDDCARHRGIEFPGHRHASLYDVNTIEPAVRDCLEAAGVEVLTGVRVTAVTRRGRSLVGVATGNGHGDRMIHGGAFVDATGTAGPPGNCVLHGNGCAMCIFRCPSFGPRRGLAELAGVDELTGTRPGGELGSFSGSCDLRMETLSPALRELLTSAGVAVLPLPSELQHATKLTGKACQQYNLPAYGQGLVLLDTGVAKMMSPYLALDDLRSLPGLARARYAEPLAGGLGNAIRFIGMAPHGRDLRVSRLSNVFCAGEKSGPGVGHTEAVVTGMLAGHNAARTVRGLAAVTIPGSLASGDFISQLTRVMRRGDVSLRLTFAGATYFERMRRQKAYTQDTSAIRERVLSAGLTGELGKPLP
jgi:hypothetical protein